MSERKQFKKENGDVVKSEDDNIKSEEDSEDIIKHEETRQKNGKHRKNGDRMLGKRKAPVQIIEPPLPKQLKTSSCSDIVSGSQWW